MSTFIERVVNGFKMRQSDYKSPCECDMIRIPDTGVLQFRLNRRDRNDPDINALFKLLECIHSYCILLFSKNYMVDAFEISWTVQIYIYKSHKIGNICVRVCNDIPYLHKKNIIRLIYESIASTCLTKDNAIEVFRNLSSKILEI